MTARRPGSPGSHPHADRRNWQPATTLDEYLRNCREGIEEPSDRRLAKITGWSRAYIWRMREAGAIPDELFERLIALDQVPTLRELATIGRLLSGDAPPEADERCPCCGHVLRTRRLISAEAERVLSAWLAEREARPCR